MHSKNINKSTNVKDPWIIVHHSWDPRPLPKHPFYCCTIHLIMFLKNDSSGNGLSRGWGVGNNVVGYQIVGGGDGIKGIAIK
jgi:hypothetical protein